MIRTTRQLLTTSTVVLTTCAALYADEKPAATPATSYDMPAAQSAINSPSAGLMNDWLRENYPGLKSWDIGGQFRFRYEMKDNMAQAGAPVKAPVDFRAVGGDANNTYLLFRETVHLGYTPCDWVNVFAEARSSSSTGDDRNPNAESDIFDLHQGYVKLGDAKEFPLTLKVGRQELVYGDERLVGAFDWNNIGRVFDGAKLRYENSDLWVEAFTARVVLANDGNFDVPNDYDWFSGVYASTKTLIPNQETQLYFLARNTGLGSPTATTGSPQAGGVSPRDIYTIGTHFKSSPGAYGGWDYDGEFAGQFGRYKATAASPSLGQRAMAAHIAGGYTWTEAYGTPRVGVEYNYASGGSTNNGHHETFDNLFPTNHKFFGIMDMTSWQNIHDLRFNSSIKPFKKLKFTANYRAYFLASTADSFYLVTGAARTTGGYGVNPSYGSYVGSEVDLVATYTIKPWAILEGGYGHFFVGDYVKSSLAAVGGATDANYVYLQATLNF